jgi:hypothetical protein
MKPESMPADGVVAGSRVACAVCGSEAIVLASNEPSLDCCDTPLTVIFTPHGERPGDSSKGA